MSFRFSKIFFISICLSAFNVTNAQSKFTDNLTVQLDANYGFILPEYSNFNLLINKPSAGLEFSITKKTTGKTYWEQVYKYPEFGLSFFFITLGNKDVLGNEFALYPFVKTFLIRKERFQLTNQFGLGAGYATKRFDLETNFQQIAIGSKLNVHFNYKLGTQFKLTNRLSLNAGLSFSHFSNANMSEPNLGINLVTGLAGLNYALSDPKVFTVNEIPQHEKKNEFALVYAAGGKHTRALQSTVYFTSSLSAEYKFHWKRKFHFGGGLDLFYDSSTKIEMGPDNPDYKSIYDFRIGIHLSQEFVYDRFSFILQEGFYIGLVDQVDKSVMYNRAILRWKFSDRFLISASMKSHLHILDYPELGFGYYFIKKK
ncbi:MAG: hypothetical protein RI883_1884 [Bacteroidota bacterium]|jgi:hypothetical protein